MTPGSWSFWMPTEDHASLRWILARYRARLTPQGRTLVAALLVAVVLSSRGTAVVAYLIPCVLLAVLLAGWFLGLAFRPRVRAVRRISTPPTAGQVFRYRVHLENLGTRSVRALTLLEGTFPMGLYKEPEDAGGIATLEHLEPGEQQVVELALRCPYRGAYLLQHLYAGSSFPSGFIRWPRKAGERETLTVYPRFVPQVEFQVPVGRRYQPGGIAVSSGVGDSTEFFGTRPYRDGDRLRDIHWPSYARSGKLIVKEYREEYFVRVGLVLDTTLGGRGQQWQEALEGRVSLAAGIADALARRDFIIDLFAAGEDFHHLQAGRALARLENVLELLACVDSSREVDFIGLESRLLPLLQQLSSVVVLLQDWDAEREAFCRRIQELGCGLRILLVRTNPPTEVPWPEVTVLQPSDALERVV